LGLKIKNVKTFEGKIKTNTDMLDKISYFVDTFVSFWRKTIFPPPLLSEKEKKNEDSELNRPV